MVNTCREIGLCGWYREAAALWGGWQSSVGGTVSVADPLGTVAKYMVLPTLASVNVFVIVSKIRLQNLNIYMQTTVSTATSPVSFPIVIAILWQ